MVEDERSSQLFAMKVISKQARRERKQMNLQMRTFENDFKREAALLKNMNHPHIIKMIHSAQGKERQKSGESRKSNRSSNSSSGEEQDAKMESE